MKLNGFHYKISKLAQLDELNFFFIYFFFPLKNNKKIKHFTYLLNKTISIRKKRKNKIFKYRLY